MDGINVQMSLITKTNKKELKTIRKKKMLKKVATNNHLKTGFFVNKDDSLGRREV